MKDIEKKIKELENRIIRLEKGKKLYDDPHEIINAYDLSALAKLRDRK